MTMKSPKNRAMGLLLAGGLLVICLGCSSLDLFSERFQSPDGLPLETSERLVGDVAVPYGTFPVTVEGIGMVSCLPGTGSDPPPSPHRAELLAEMKARGVEHPSRVLASKNTALVLVRGVLPPGIQKGDPLDIEVRVLGESETTSLRGGYLLDTRLKEMQILDDRQLHKGREWGIGKGPILVDPSAEVENNPILACRGRILGGGTSLKSRSLGLVLQEGYQNVFYASRVANVINKRFYATSPGGVQEGMAKAHTDQYIELKVHERYHDNIPRYMQVVRSVALHESPAKRLQRMALLEKQLLDPITSARAALQLEAVGRQGIDLLKNGIASDDTEVRFRSAEALAYLDQSEAAMVLAQIARDEPAFRVFALTALAAMNDPVAYQELCTLLESSSAETRYGAFRALWAMNPNDPRVLGEKLASDFSYHVLATSGPPMVHVTRNRRAEVVLFGQGQQFLTPLLLEAGPRIRVRGEGNGQIAVSRFAVGQPDQKRIVSTRVDDVIRAIAELGGTYPDVVQALQQAKTKGALTSRFEVDALPEAGRHYERTAGTDGDRASEGDEDDVAAEHSPFAWFTRQGGNDPPDHASAEGNSAESPQDEPASTQNPHPVRNFFAKMTGQDSD